MCSACGHGRVHAALGMGLTLTSLPPLPFSAPPTIWGSNETSEVAVMEGHPVRFLCEARGVPTPDITWSKDGAPLPHGAEAIYTRGGRQLQLGRARGSDAGLYTCKASNPAGVVEKATRLEVYGEWPEVAATGSGQLGAVARLWAWWPLRVSKGGEWLEAQDSGTKELAREKGHLSWASFPQMGETEAGSRRVCPGAQAELSRESRSPLSV